METTQPSILQVETGYISQQSRENLSANSAILDYQIYSHVPPLWRKIEKAVQMDLYLAIRAARMARHYDIVWAGSEKVGIPLSFLPLKKPLVVVAHHLESPKKDRFLRTTGIIKKWAGIGYLSNESKERLIRCFNVPAELLFQYESCKYLSRFVPNDLSYDGAIMSVGAAKRDYNTLLQALISLKGYQTNIYGSSKFGDQLRQALPGAIPEWVQFMGFVDEEELIRRYHQARFVVVPLEKTTHPGAGINAVLEAGAFAKAVISSNTGGMPSFVKDGITGILIPPNDPIAMQTAIQKLWTNPELSIRMGKAGRDFVETQYNRAAVNANISRFLLDVKHRHTAK